MKKVIVLGANGMAGHIITLGLRAETERYDVIAIARTDSFIKPEILLDITDFESLNKLIKNSHTDVIINCIGLLNQRAEDHIDQAILLNSYLPHYLETITQNTSTKIIHISTDCVFSGSKGGYKEDDIKDGKGFYAQSKALGEIINKKDLTIRTSIIGPELNSNGIGLLHWFSKQTGDINGYTQSFWNGITTIELMNAIKKSIENDITGLYHLVYSEKISKFDLIKLFAESFDMKNINIHPKETYKVDKSLINTRTDFNYSIPDYKKMIMEMKEWIYNHSNLYTHYQHLFKQ